MRGHENEVVARLVELLTPVYPELDPANRSQVQQDVTAFVCSQIGLMPSFLRLPYRLALMGFNWLPVLRYGKPFVRLGDDTATRCLSLWSERGIGLTRNFVKLIRSCALLAYFDHPKVRTCLEQRQPVTSLPRAVGNGVR